MDNKLIYIATSFDNIPEQRRWARLLRAEGWEQTFDWTQAPALGTGAKDEGLALAINELQGVLEASAILVLLPGGLGTHLEMGAALGAGKRVVIVGAHRHTIRPDGRPVAWYEMCQYVDTDLNDSAAQWNKVTCGLLHSKPTDEELGTLDFAGRPRACGMHPDYDYRIRHGSIIPCPYPGCSNSGGDRETIDCGDVVLTRVLMTAPPLKERWAWKVVRKVTTIGLLTPTTGRG